MYTLGFPFARFVC